MGESEGSSRPHDGDVNTKYLIEWNDETLAAAVTRSEESLILEIRPSDNGAAAESISDESRPHAVAKTQLEAAATTVLELDASAARLVRSGETVRLRVPPPSTRLPRTISRASDADVLRPRIEELVAPQLYGALPHPSPHPFQEYGIAWLQRTPKAILADDMGLGKTAQALLALQALVVQGQVRSALIVCPKSLTANWEQECRTWTPALTIVRPLPRTTEVNQLWASILGRSHIVIASYEQLRPLPSALRDIQSQLVIADEAHRLRRSQAQLVQSFRQMHATRFWALTGTPIERHPLDLATLLSILEPTRFSARSAASESDLKSAAAPYLLRRLKSDVLEELPEVVEVKEVLELTAAQQASYALARRQPLDGSSGAVLQRLMILRSICDVDSNSEASAKLERIGEILANVRDSGEKALVFSYLLRPLELLHEQLLKDEPRLHALRLTGAMTSDERHQALDRFRSDQRITALLCSSRVGGEGLTLTEANHVIFLNEWWNPSANDQARDRVVRLGQTKVVHVHRFRCRNTVEDALDDILSRKEATFARVVDALASEIGLEVSVSESLVGEVLERIDAD